MILEPLQFQKAFVFTHDHPNAFNIIQNIKAQFLHLFYLLSLRNQLSWRIVNKMTIQEPHNEIKSAIKIWKLLSK